MAHRSITLDDAVTRYLRLRADLKPTTIREYDYHLRALCGFAPTSERRLGQMTVGRINRRVLRDFLSRFVSPHVHNGHMRSLSAFFACCTDDVNGLGFINTNPMQGVKSRRPTPVQHHAMTPDQCRLVLNRLYGRDPLAWAAVKLALEAVARRTDIFMLQWPNFEFVLGEGPDGPVVNECRVKYVPSKTSRLRPFTKTVALAPTLAAWLYGRRQSHPDGFVFRPWYRDSRTGQQAQCSLVTTWGRWLMGHLRAAHAECGIPCDRTPLHAVRAAAATHLIEQGATYEQIGGAFGWDARTIRDHYARPRQEELAAGMNALRRVGDMDAGLIGENDHV
jgi:site-specific recombinase XerD